eukprot:GILI01011097.1.p1 GENE.GILI01011097.1~~GILI01011097.1.p1  ORF type:complete len:447 (+),score=53.87 GILI01011097.1:261-1601(+)
MSKSDYIDFPGVLGNEADHRSKYIRVRPLGAGSFAEAWEVRRRSDGAIFAAKIMRLKTMDVRALKRANSEVQCLQSCSHFACLSFVEHYESEEGLLLIVEYCNAGDLASYISACRETNQPFPEPTIAIIILQLVLALEHMHRRKIIHRDIKSQNVFLSTTGLVKVGDFGLSNEYETVSGDVAKTICGTPYYLAPEVWMRQRYGIKADIWALGVLSYELITGRCPFVGSDMHSLSAKVLEGTPPSINPAKYKVSKELIDIVEAMLTKDPIRRPNALQLLMTSFFRKQLAAFVPTVENTDRVSPEMKTSIATCVREVEGHLQAAMLALSAHAAQSSAPTSPTNLTGHPPVDALAYEGPVKKKKDTRFVDRYLVLRTGSLEVLEDSTKPRQRRPLPLTAIRGAEACDDGEGGNCFQITTLDNHSYVFYSNDRDAWLQALSDALQACDLR